MIFARRGDRGPDPFVWPKVLLFVVGAVLGLVGMAMEESILVTVAILVLFVAVALRVAGGRRKTDGQDPEDPNGGEPFQDPVSKEEPDAERDGGQA